MTSNQASTPPVVGMIAGNGIYPETFARAARQAGVPRLVAAAFKNETKAEFENEVDEIAWFKVGQLNKMIKFFNQHQVEKAVMVGQIAPKNLFDFSPDLRTTKMLMRVKQRNAESLFGAIAEEMEKDGISLISAVTYLDEFLPKPGLIGGPKLSESQQQDAVYGMHIAKEVSRLDIGQTVVVKEGTVLAVEAFEGTNEAIKRGAKLGKKKAMMVKVSKPNQDFRFDVPCVGPETIKTAAEAGVNAIVIEADCTLLLGQAEVLELCKSKKVSLVACSDENSV